MRVRAGEKVIDDVRTEVRDGTLQVTFDHDGFGGSDVVVEASVPELTGSRSTDRATSTPTASTAARSRSASDGSGDVARRHGRSGWRSTSTAPATPISPT